MNIEKENITLLKNEKKKKNWLRKNCRYTAVGLCLRSDYGGAVGAFIRKVHIRNALRCVLCVLPMSHFLGISAAAWTIMLRSLYFSKVAQTTVQKGKGKYPPCSLGFPSLCPFVHPYWTRLDTWTLIPDTPPLLSQKNGAIIERRNTGTRERRIFTFCRTPSAAARCHLLH